MELRRLMGDDCTEGQLQVFRSDRQTSGLQDHERGRHARQDAKGIRRLPRITNDSQHHSRRNGRSLWEADQYTAGGPLSMMITSLLMRAWITHMKSIAVQPRVLADDLQFPCTGLNHLKLFETGFHEDP